MCSEPRRWRFGLGGVTVAKVISPPRYFSCTKEGLMKSPPLSLVSERFAGRPFSNSSALQLGDER